MEQRTKEGVVVAGMSGRWQLPQEGEGVGDLSLDRPVEIASAGSQNEK